MSQARSERRALTEGARKLRDFMKTHGISQAVAGDALGVSGPAVHEWLHGTQRPKPHFRDAIETWTSGSVKASMWERANEAKKKVAVTPFVPNAVERPTGT